MGFQTFDLRKLDQQTASFSHTFTPGTPGTFWTMHGDGLIQDIIITNTDTADHVVTFFFNSSTDDGRWISVKVLAGQGDDGVLPAVSILSLLPTTMQPLVVPTNITIYYDIDAAPAVGKFVNMLALLGYF